MPTNCPAFYSSAYDVTDGFSDLSGWLWLVLRLLSSGSPSPVSGALNHLAHQTQEWETTKEQPWLCRRDGEGSAGSPAGGEVLLPSLSPSRLPSPSALRPRGAGICRLLSPLVIDAHSPPQALQSPGSCRVHRANCGPIDTAPKTVSSAAVFPQTPSACPWPSVRP